MTQTLIALDTETTGIGPKEHRLTEIAALEFDPVSGDPTGRYFHTFLNPERDIPEEVSKVHGKTWDDLKGEPLFADKAEEFLEFVRGNQVVIHNAPFDVGFLDEELGRVKLMKLGKTVTSVTDTLALSRRHVRARSHTLDALMDRYSIDRSRRTLHGALIDCEMLAQVYPRLMAEVNRTRVAVNSLLPFPLDADTPDSIEEAAQRWLVLDELKKLLEADQKRYGAALKKLCQGIDQEGDTFEIEFTNRTSTDWDRVVADHLEGVDLAPYRKGSSAMYVRHR